jgi:hypothetical protein
MKTVMLFSFFFITLNALSQFNKHTQFDSNEPMFDKAIGCTMGYSANGTIGNLSSSVSVGVHGNRLPISLMIGGGYMEFNYKSTWGVNALAMLRLCKTDYLNLNGYSMIYRQSGKTLYEVGGKFGMFTNDQSILYLQTGYTFDKAAGKTESGKAAQYKAVTVGASFSLLL